jgi:hypothetical protein
MAIIFVVFVVLLILFFWLHFIMAQQIESVGREIQAAQQELDKIQRKNDMLKGQIVNASTQKSMAQRAREHNYQPQEPLYLSVDQPLPPSSQAWDETGLSILWAGAEQNQNVER